MEVVLHCDPTNPSKLLGIWAPAAQVGGSPRCFYPAGSEAQAVGLGVMDGWSEIRPRADWRGWIRYLAGRVPYTAWWETFEVADDCDLEAAFVVASATVLASAAAIHGTVDGGWTAKMMSKEDELSLTGDWVGLVAHRYGGPGEPYRPEQRLSSRFAFRVDDATLLVGLTKPKATQGDADLALAYGLAHAGDRDLWVVLPDDLAAPTLERAAFLETKIRVFTFGENGVVEEPIPAVATVLGGPTEQIVTDTMVLGDRAAWVTALVGWADGAPALEPAHRKSYLAWHCEGRLVLRVRRVHQGLEIAAGVQYSKPTGVQPAPVIEQITESLSALQTHRLVSAAARACVDRLAGVDTGHGEHRLQARLEAHHLGLRPPLRREFPARRPPGRRAYIDFLGVDASGDLHIVETKIGADAMLVLQGLDYWIWAQRHLDQLIPILGLKPRPRVCIDFVVASPDAHQGALGPYSAAQAEALAGDIRWRFHTVTGWQAGDVHVDSSARARSVPTDAPRVHDPRWAVRLGRHLTDTADAAGTSLTAGVFWPAPGDGLVSAAGAAYEQLRREGLDHKMIGHVRSSQAFALNLFAPLTPDGLRAIWRLFSHEVADAELPVFEWSDPDDRLGEATTHSPHRTQVDVILRATTEDGSRVAALIEVKLSETDFGHCSAYASANNPNRAICDTSAPFGGDTGRCFQLSNKDGSHRRRYDRYLEGIIGHAGAEVGCPFRYSNQPMRNVALARSLVEHGDIDHAVVALCAPEVHRAIWRRWRTARACLGGLEHVYLADLPASAVLQYHVHDDADALAVRYQLDGRARRKLVDRADAQAALDALYPNGAFYERVDRSGTTTTGSVFSRPIITDTGDDWIEITSPPSGYPLPLSFRVPKTSLNAAPGPDGIVHLQLAAPDECGITRRLSSRLDRRGVDLAEVARDRATVHADYFDFDFTATPLYEER